MASQGIDTNKLKDIIGRQTDEVNAKMAAIKPGGDGQVGILEMFDVQLAVNKLSQLTEMSTNIQASAHSANQAMARKISG